MERKFVHDEQNHYESIGLDKKEIRQCQRKYEDIIDDMPKEGGRKSHLTEAVYNAAKKDDNFFVYVVSLSQKSEKPDILSGLLAGLKDRFKDGPPEDGCDCPDCVSKRAELAKAANTNSSDVEVPASEG